MTIVGKRWIPVAVLLVLRAEVDACLATRGRMELRLQGLAEESGRLRRQVDSLEGLDPRGIPAGDYDHYLDLVDQFNETILEWERQAEIGPPETDEAPRRLARRKASILRLQ